MHGLNEGHIAPYTDIEFQLEMVMWWLCISCIGETGNLVILAGMGEEFWCGQAQNGINFDFQS